MSIISSALKATKTGKLFAEDAPIALGMVSVEKRVREIEPRVAYEYEIAVKIACMAVISNKDDFEDVFKRIKQLIIGNIYGEFRPHLASIRLAMYNRDNCSALTAVDSLEKAMFDVV